jgi:outer membrane protein assembly factor BamA
MKIVISFVFLVSFHVAIAQRHYFGSKAGIVFSNSSFENDLLQVKCLKSFTGGITYNYVFASGVNIGAEIIYGKFGYIADLSLNNRTQSYLRENISLPLKLGYKYGERYFAYANAGFVFNYIISNNIISYEDGDKDKYPLGAINTLDWNTRFTLSGFIELGIGYQFTNNMLISISSVYQREIIPTVDKYAYRVNDPFYAYSISLGMQLAIE